VSTHGHGAAEEHAALARVDLLSELSESEFEPVLHRAQRRTFHDGAVLFVEGEPCEGMYLIVSGAVRIFKSSSSGREIQLALQQAPASVAEIPVFDGGPFPASGRAVGEVVAYHVSKEAFAELVRHDPDVGLKVLAVAGERLRSLVKTVHLVTFGGIRQRLARLLLEESTNQGKTAFDLGVTHRELAAQLGTVREVVSRNLGRFHHEGLIQLDGHRVEILDPEGLEAEAEAVIR